MIKEDFVLQGRHVRLEPLAHSHIEGLVTAASADPSLYRWSFVPQGQAETIRYIDTALSWKNAGTAVPFAIVHIDGNIIIGSTRFWNLEWWPWPEGNPSHGRSTPDACEIGYTWLGRPPIRTAAHTEAKFLMLTYAFETWRVHRVCFHTDMRNERSRSAIERIGGKFEGILRAHRMAADHTVRDSARYSIIASEWSDVKQRLVHLMDQKRSGQDSYPVPPSSF